jgi:hypothetical protein
MTELKRGRFLQQNLEAAFPHLYSVRNGWLRPRIGEEVPPQSPLESGQIPYERKP